MTDDIETRRMALVRSTVNNSPRESWDEHLRRVKQPPEDMNARRMALAKSTVGNPPGGTWEDHLRRIKKPPT